MSVHTLTRTDHPAIEFRLAADSFAGCTRIEHRELRQDGQPHDDRWYRMTDEGWLWLQRQPGGTEIIDQLHAEQNRKQPSPVIRTGGILDGKTVAEVMADRDDYRRMVGE